jgi:hypothetical protein
MAGSELNELIEQLRLLQIEQASVVARIEALNNIPAATAQAITVQEERVNGISAGDDRVRIKNKVRKPATWSSAIVWTEARERLATVTRVTRDQVHFVTDNGTRTWRAPNNLIRLDRDER